MSESELIELLFSNNDEHEILPVHCDSLEAFIEQLKAPTPRRSDNENANEEDKLSGPILLPIVLATGNPVPEQVESDSRGYLMDLNTFGDIPLSIQPDSNMLLEKISDQLHAILKNQKIIMKELKENEDQLSMIENAIKDINKVQNMTASFEIMDHQILLNYPKIGSFRENKDKETEVHIGRDVWILQKKYDRAEKNSGGSYTKFIRNMARAIFENDVLIASSLTGQNCPFKAEKTARPELDPTLYMALEDMCKWWYENVKHYSKKQADSTSSVIRNTVSRLIDELRLPKDVKKERTAKTKEIRKSKRKLETKNSIENECSINKNFKKSSSDQSCFKEDSDCFKEKITRVGEMRDLEQSDSFEI